MNIKIETENCNFDNHYLVEEFADSKIVLYIEMNRVVSIQSKKHVREQIKRLIQKELSKFKWIISGGVVVEFGWYLKAVEKQETDKIGDIDNISKPIQDVLTGAQGIIIDDAQIGGLYSFWMSRNEMIAENILRIEIRFNNDETLEKKNLKFVQYDNAICMPLNFDGKDLNELFACKIILNVKKKRRKAAERIKKSGNNLDYHLKLSCWDFHRTRLGGFERKNILTLNEFNQLCENKGLTYSKLIELKKASLEIKL
jgi:Holliday junction resolvase RusA-like endonuclease